MDKYRDVKDIAKDVRKQLKKEFPKCKFSITIDRFSMGQGMTIALMNAPFAAFAKDEDVNGNRLKDAYAQLNQYQLRKEPVEHICNGRYLTPEAWAVMKRADEIQRQYNWNNSDSQMDYFDVNFYFHPQIGKWDKPFEIAHKKATGQLTAKERYEKHERSGRNAEYRRDISGSAQVY